MVKRKTKKPQVKIPLTNQGQGQTPPQDTKGQTLPQEQSQRSHGMNVNSGNNLDAIAQRIERDRAIEAAKQKQEKAKEDDLLSSPPPSPPADPSMVLTSQFVPTDEVKQIAAGLTFYITRRIVNFFSKELKPLDQDQEDRLKTSLGRLMEKYVPAAMAKYQDNLDLVLVLGGIVVSNLTDIKQPEPIEKRAQPPKAPELPTAETVFLGPKQDEK